MYNESIYKKMAEANTILRCLVGSQGYGISTDTSDRDEKGVCVESFEVFHQLHGEFEQYEYRDATARGESHNATSQPGDLDLTIYGLRKFLRLACKGNPTVIEMLFLEPIYLTEFGVLLQHLAPHIVCRNAGRSYLGYMQAQRARMLGEAGQRGVNRQDLVDKYGYDTKYASHIIRLGMQGVELLKTGQLAFPMLEDDVNRIKDIRSGKFTMNQILQQAGDLEHEVKDLISNGPLQDQPNIEEIEQFMWYVYRQVWRV